MRKIPINQAECGDVIVYRNEEDEIVHLGILIRKLVVTSNEDDALELLSKWGFDGEYFHPSSHVPSVYGRVSEAWTDRR